MAVIDNLVAYWSLEEASGNAIDAHGNNDLTDSATVGTATGKVGNARDFELGDTDYLSIADNADLSMGDIDFTIQVWVNLESKTDFQRLMGKVQTTVEYYLLYDPTPDRFRFHVNDGTNDTIVNADQLGSPSIATWYHIVAWHDASGNQIGIAINAGTADTAAHTTGVQDGTNNFYLSQQDAAMDGLLDEAGVWKRVLSAADRTWLYNSGNGRSYADIVAEAGAAGSKRHHARRMLLGVG